MGCTASVDESSRKGPRVSDGDDITPSPNGNALLPPPDDDDRRSMIRRSLEKIKNSTGPGIKWSKVKAISRMSLELSSKKYTSNHRKAKPGKTNLKATSVLEKIPERMTSSHARSAYSEASNLMLVDNHVKSEMEWGDMAEGVAQDEPLANKLFVAAGSGNTEAATKLVNAVINNGLSLPPTHAPAALCAAVVNDQREAVRLLLSKAKELRLELLTCQDEYGNSPLKLAAAGGHREILKMLIGVGMKPDATTENGKTALMCAAENGHLECVSDLIEAGASAALLMSDETGPVTLAARGGHVEVMKLLVSHGADAREFSHVGETPLFAAVDNNHAKAAWYILGCGEGLDGRNAEGMTALMLAAYQGYTQVVNVLLHCGAEVNVGDVDGDTPLWAAAKSGHLDTVETLLNAGADVDKERMRGESPLWIAAFGNHLETAEMLLKNNADVDCIDTKDVTPLLMAVSQQRAKMAKLLMDYGADLEARDYQGNTPVTTAVTLGCLDILKMLMERGASLKVKLAGCDLMTLAANHHQKEILRFLSDTTGLPMPRTSSEVGANVESNPLPVSKMSNR